jgi:cell division protein FtsL
MSRLNMLLFGSAVVLAILVVHEQNRARRLFMDLQKEKDTAEQLAIEWNQLQIEQGMLSANKRIEEGAVKGLQMQLPPPGKVKLIVVDKTASRGTP